jgi:hypothetical protein
MELCERITDGDQLPLGLKPAVKKNLASFVGVIRKLRKAAQNVCTLLSIEMSWLTERVPL